MQFIETYAKQEPAAFLPGDYVGDDCETEASSLQKCAYADCRNRIARELVSVD